MCTTLQYAKNEIKVLELIIHYVIRKIKIINLNWRKKQK